MSASVNTAVGILASADRVRDVDVAISPKSSNEDDFILARLSTILVEIRLEGSSFVILDATWCRSTGLSLSSAREIHGEKLGSAVDGDDRDADILVPTRQRMGAKPTSDHSWSIAPVLVNVSSVESMVTRFRCCSQDRVGTLKPERDRSSQ